MLGKKKITIKSIAKQCGVSSYTVSKIINNQPEASKETQKRVLSIVKKMGYTPDPLARGMRNRSLQSVTVILPYKKGNFSTLYFDELIRGVNDSVIESSYYMSIIVKNEGGKDKAEEFYNTIEKSSLFNNLIVVAPDKLEIRNLRQYIKTKKIILINARSNQIPCITINNFGSMYELIKYLICKGHKRIGYLDIKGFSFDSKERFDAYKQAISEYKIDFSKSLVARSNYNIIDMENAVSGLLKNKGLTAIAASNDMLAVYLLKVLYTRNIRVPDEIAVTGFDDIRFSEACIPSLTTVKQPLYEMGRKAFDILVKNRNPKSFEFDGKTIYRDSA